MGLAEMFGFGGGILDNELPDIFPLAMEQKFFIEIDVRNIYSRILIDVIERTHGLSDEYQAALWDNCLQGESNYGLVTHLACAMSEKKDLFLVYDRAVKLLRMADPNEQKQIRDDYARGANSTAGVFISFSKYQRTDMVRLYSALEYCTVSALNKAMNVAKSLQYKMNDMRASTSLKDSADVKAQAKQIAKSLGKGKDVLLDAKDQLETQIPDLVAVQAAMSFVNHKRSFYLGMPASYITGEAPAGLGDSGEGEAKATERGLKNYYFSVIKPVLSALFDATTTFKSQDFRQIDSAINAMKIFELTDDTLVSKDNKTLILNTLLGLDEDDKGDPAPKVVTPFVAPNPAAPAY